jgi:protein-tyrosine phosphatase
MNYLKRNFGSYRAAVFHVKEQLWLRAGRYSALENIDWARITRLVFVCTGNVCRSPYAEVRARKLGFPSISLGLDTSGNVPANHNAQRNARPRSIDLSAHRSKLFDPGVVQPGDLVLVFEPRQFRLMKKQMPKTAGQVTLIGLWAEPKLAYIPDPYNAGDAYFQRCFDLIDACVARIATRAGTARVATG